MGNNKRERRQRAIERERGRASGSTAPPAAPQTTVPPRPQNTSPVTLDDLSMRIRPGHRIDDMIRMGQVFEGLNMGPPACRLYAELLPLAQHERGWDDPVTLTILASYLAALHAEGDTAGAARVRAVRAAGPSVATPPPVAQRPNALTPGYGEMTVQFRRDHMFEDSLNYARLNHKSGLVGTMREGYLDTARKWYLNLLPQAEKEKGWDHPVTTGIVASLFDVFQAQGDSAAAVKLMMERSQGGVKG